ncbi:7SK snRNA methylphosphate capping enzyme [Frankliniella fusca]|uniref:RNA methyltransferase n=1 Tax=Frankliniella fusca TaxID=407009 RepID=A0AAE1HE77_9NEOP|nr:7SK snRNA methylphosphate capping enzyme [Frankliniella fusca]
MVVPRSAPELELKFGWFYPVLASESGQISFIRSQSNIHLYQNMSQVAAILDGGGGATGPGGGGGTGACGGGSGSGGGRRRALAHNNMNFPRKQNIHSHKHGRKRLQSGGDRGGKFHIPHKKRRKDGHIPPTKFLLGGNICDPLNLGSLQDEEINRAMNAVTPKSSPIPTPKHRKGEVEVIIPPNINDPLNLNSCEDEEEYMAQLANSGGSPVKKAHRNKSKRKKKRLSAISNSSKGEENADCQTTLERSGNLSMTSDSGETGPDNVSPVKERAPAATLPVNPGENAAQGGGDSTEAAAPEPAKTHESPMKRPNRRSEEGTKERRPRKVDLKDKIVSPVVWQPGQKHVHGHHHGHGHHAHARNQKFREKRNSSEPKIEPKFRAKDVTFQYGNFNRYYGYRNPSSEPDLRLRCFAEYPELFRDRDVLDIGCNVGHITLSIGRDFRARSVVGIDIDRKLIEIARKNVRHYVNYEQSPAPTASGTPSSTPSHCTPSYTSSLGIQNQITGKERSPHDRFFPISMPIVYGPIDIPGITDGIRTPRPASAPLPFPKNISFVQGNYVLDSDSLLALEQPQFDVILCLSITKWFHLNWGDAGLKRAFRRMYLQLRPGGCLILEPQGWPSYNRKKKLTEAIWKNYNSIEFFPNQFREYLLSPEVGFSHCRILDIPQHSAKGFRRPITMFVKGDPSPAHSALSIDSSTVLPPTVYAQTSCDGASPMSGTPDPHHASPGQNLPCTSPCGANFTPDNPVVSPRNSGPTPKYQYASPGPSSFTPDHPIASPLPSGTVTGQYCASPMSGSYTPDPQSASPAQSCVTPDYAGASPMPASLTPDPRSVSPGSMTPDPRSTSPFPSGIASDFRSASPTESFAPDTQGASCDTSDGEATRFETQDRNQTKAFSQGTFYNDQSEKSVSEKTEEPDYDCDASGNIVMDVVSAGKGNQDLSERQGDLHNDPASSAVQTKEADELGDFQT